ncbi:Clathrin heavy chain 2 [Tulasnella sp. 418]|nr:Clathrin heavy chain 2 [Tulasnella sp. 418]
MKGKITRQSISPIWGDSSIDSPFKSQYPPEKQILLKQDSSSTNVKELSRKTETHQEKDPVTQQSSPRLSTLSLSTEDLESIATEELGSIVTLSQMDGYLQRDRERPPRLTQPQQPSGTSTELKDVVPTLVQSSEIRDKSISKAETRGSDLASVRPPLAWEGVVKEFQFLNSQSVCTPSLIGAYDDWVVSASSGVLLFTLSSRAVLYSTVRKTGREIHYGLHVKSTSSVAHNLSPDGKTLIRWISSEEKKGNRLVAIDVRSKQQKAQLQRDYQYQQCDILNARWVDDYTIYIPVSKEGIVILWTIQDSRYNLLEDSFVRPEDPVIIQPFASIIRHSQLKFEITRDRGWWIATGMTPSDSPSGLVEVHDVENDESRIVEGMVSRIAEVDVYDEEKALLVSASLTPDSKLQLCVQQVDPSASGQPFIPVDVKVDSIEEKDYPRDIIILHPFSIVALMTEKFYIYFFELNTGAYLFSQAQNPYKFCPSQSNEHGLWIWSHEKSDVRALTINKDDLIGYCRQVLGNDRLASTIAIRTGLGGAEDVILDDMYGRYQDVVGCAPEP